MDLRYVSVHKNMLWRILTTHVKPRLINCTVSIISFFGNVNFSSRDYSKFKPVDENLECDLSNKSYWNALQYDTVYLSLFFKTWIVGLKPEKKFSWKKRSKWKSCKVDSPIFWFSTRVLFPLLRSFICTPCLFIGCGSWAATGRMVLNMSWVTALMSRFTGIMATVPGRFLLCSFVLVSDHL